MDIRKDGVSPVHPVYNTSDLYLHLLQGGEGDKYPFDIWPTDDVRKWICGMHLPLCRLTLIHWTSSKIS